MTPNSYDPWDDAGSAEAPPLYYYGQISMDVWPCVLIKGQGKVPFDAGQHRVEDRRTAIELIITPLADQRASFTLQRSIIAQSPEWYRYIWPSLKALGLTNPKEAIDKWCKCEQVGTGRTYRNSAGEEREARTVKFLALYDSEDACRAAYYADTGQAHDDEGDDVTEAHPATGGGNGNAKERETALQFVKVLVQQHKGDRAVVAEQIAAMPMLSKWFTIDSPEVVQLLQEAAA